MKMKRIFNPLEDPCGRTKTMNFLRHFTEQSNFAANCNKADVSDQRVICFHLSWHAKNENKSRKGPTI